MTELEELKLQIKQLENKVEELEGREKSAEQPIQTDNPVPSIQNSIIDTKNTPNKPTYIPVPITPHKASKNRDLENVYSKNILPVLASIFVFIGLMFFASIVLKDVPLLIQCIFTYILSFAIFGVGFFFRRKDNAKIFSNALMGCGIGAVYISIFATKIYFNLVHDIVLFLLVASWSTVINIMSLRMDNGTFIKIGSIGISISVILGAIGALYDWQFVFMAIYFGILILSYYYFNSESDSWTDIFMNSSFFVALLVFIFSFESSSLTFSDFVLVTIPLLSLALSDLLLLRCSLTIDKLTEKEWIPMRYIETIFVAPVMISIYAVIRSLIAIDVNNIVVTIIGIALIILEFFILDNRFNVFVERAIHILLLTMFFFVVDSASINIQILMPIVLCLYMVYCVFFEKYWMLSFASGLNMFGTAMMFGNDTANLPILITVAVMCVLPIILLFAKAAENVNPWAKISLLLNLCFCASFIFFVIADFDIFLLALTMLISLMPILPIFEVARGSGLDDKDMIKRYHIVQCLAMFTAIIMGTLDNDLLFAIPAISCFLLDRDLKHMESVNGFSKGIQMTILVSGIIAMVLGSGDYGFIISLANILVSIASIFVGVKFKNKSFRKYGLVLSFISLAKLVFIDISYSSMLQTAIAFILAGLLSFGIVKIYSKLEKLEEDRNNKD